MHIMSKDNHVEKVCMVDWGGTMHKRCVLRQDARATRNEPENSQGWCWWKCHRSSPCTRVVQILYEKECVRLKCVLRLWFLENEALRGCVEMKML